jgi:prohibitin 2
LLLLQIHDALLMRAKDFAIELDDVAITHLSFSREYTAAVEAKQVAQQDSERAKYVVMKAVQEKASHNNMLHSNFFSKYLRYCAR